MPADARRLSANDLSVDESLLIGEAVPVGKARVLRVSTDPASNLDEMLDTPLGRHPAPIAGASGLRAMNIDP